MVVHPQPPRILPYMFARMTRQSIGPSVKVAPTALSTITQVALRSRDGLETGGILLGTDNLEGISIRHAGDPGLEAIRRENFFMRDLNHARRLGRV